MNERRIIDLLILFVVVYSVYNINMWFTRNTQEEAVKFEKKAFIAPETIKYTKQIIIRKPITKTIPLFVKNACSVLEVFTKKPPVRRKRREPMTIDDNMLTMLGITSFLMIILVNSVVDVLKLKEKERAKRRLNPDGERRQSLAEFAGKKTLRRGSSKLFQIDESSASPDEQNNSRRQTKLYTRGESINSYLSELHRKPQEGSAPASTSETPSGDSQPKLVKRQSATKLFGARPVPMVRRSSFPALPLNPDVQALMLGHRQTSVDSDDEGDGKGRRVRIIRRF